MGRSRRCLPTCRAAHDVRGEHGQYTLLTVRITDGIAGRTGFVAGPVAKREMLPSAEYQASSTASPASTLTKKFQAATVFAGPSWVNALQICVNGPSVVAGDVGDIFCRFEPPFDLEADYTGIDQLRDQVVCCKILWAQEIINVSQVHDLAVFDQFIAHAAGLGALPPIGRAATQGFTGQALAGVGDAKGTVDKGFQRHARFFGVNLLNLFDGKLPGQYHTVATHGTAGSYALGAGHRHLG